MKVLSCLNLMFPLLDWRASDQLVNSSIVFDIVRRSDKCAFVAPADCGQLHRTILFVVYRSICRSRTSVLQCTGRVLNVTGRFFFMSYTSCRAHVLCVDTTI